MIRPFRPRRRLGRGHLTCHNWRIAADRGGSRHSAPNALIARSGPAARDRDPRPAAPGGPQPAMSSAGRAAGPAARLCGLAHLLTNGRFSCA